MIDSNTRNGSRRQHFIEWLSSKEIGNNSPSIIIDALDTGSDYCINHKMCRNSFWEMSPSEFEMISSQLLQKKWFMQLYYLSARYFEAASRYYIDFLLQV